MNEQDTNAPPLSNRVATVGPGADLASFSNRAPASAGREPTVVGSGPRPPGPVRGT
jgi:hypothetical protein